MFLLFCFFFFSSRRRHTMLTCCWSSDVCSSDLALLSWGISLRRLAERAWPARQVSVSSFASSEERRVGKECRSRGSPYHKKKKRKVDIAVWPRDEPTDIARDRVSRRVSE